MALAFAALATLGGLVAGFASEPARSEQTEEVAGGKLQGGEDAAPLRDAA